MIWGIWSQFFYNRIALTHFFPLLSFDPLKTSENKRFSDVFREIIRKHLEEMASKGPGNEMANIIINKRIPVNKT